MRSFIHVMGPTVRRLNLSESVVHIDVLKVMATGIERLDAIDFAWCPCLVAESIREFISCCNRSLTKLNLSHCPMLNDDALGWIAGVLGPQGSLTQCTKLLSLDISYTTNIGDRGLTHLGVGCRAIQFLNLEGIERITNTGILRIVEGCKNLRVLSLKKCMQLSDAALFHLGRHGTNLRSVNLMGCYNMTSTGLHMLVTGTPQLQSLNLEGCRKMKEDILAAVAVKCLSLQVLNVNGCQEITDNGILTLSQHLPYVTKARHYRGLEPKSDSLQLRFSTQQRTIQNSAVLRIQSVYRGHVGRAVASTWRRERIEIPAANRIRKNVVCYRLHKEIGTRAARSKLLRASAVKIQSVMRGVLCRMRLAEQDEERRRLVVWGKAAIKVQAMYKSYWTRKHLPLVYKTIERYRREQFLLRKQAAVVRLQRAFRKRYNRSRFDDVMAIHRRQRQEREKAATLLQRLYRTRAARKAYRVLLEVVHSQQQLVKQLVRYAIQLQSQWRGHRGRRQLSKAREDFARREQRKYNAASRINAGVRGYFARRRVQYLRVERQTRTRAARTIQKQWRIYKSPSPERLRMESMLTKMKQQVAYEALVALKKKDDVIQKARALVNRDSASEPESDDDWGDFQDDNGYQFWFSPSRNSRLYVRPNENAHEKSLLGMACRVLWPLEQQWFSGKIDRYNRSKNKHRILYDDGDHEWLCLPAQGDRVQLYNGFCWCMARMYEPSMRALKASVFLGVRLQMYDARAYAWRSGEIKAYNEQSDTFLVAYDGDDGSGVPSEEWVDLFRLEHAVQVQDTGTQQWSSLSGYVFGPELGRPTGNLKPSDATYYFGVEDYLTYVEPRPELPVEDREVVEEEAAVTDETLQDAGEDTEGDADDEDEEEEEDEEGGDDDDEEADASSDDEEEEKEEEEPDDDGSSSVLD
jgi:hypothetical protein